MKVILRDIGEEILEACAKAERNCRTVREIEISKSEMRELELLYPSAYPDIPCPEIGIVGIFNGVNLRVI